MVFISSFIYPIGILGEKNGISYSRLYVEILLIIDIYY